MGYLSIKNLDENKINIQNTNNYYSLSYKHSYVRLSSILIELNNKLDDFLMKHIFNYKGILHENGSEYYLYLKKNDYLDNFMKDFTDEKIYINIIKLKKTASHIFPIVYVL